MNKADTIDQAKLLVGPTVASLVSDPVWEYGVARSVTFDEEGRAPGAPAYVESYDAAWLAADAVDLLALQMAAEDRTTKLSVNGDSIEVKLGDLPQLALGLRRQSPLFSLMLTQGAQLMELKMASGLAEFTPLTGA